MTVFLFDVWSELRQQVCRVAFSESALYIYNIFSSAPAHVPVFFYCDLVNHNERFGHTSAASGPSEWKAVHRFAPLPVRQIMALFAYLNRILLRRPDTV